MDALQKNELLLAENLSLRKSNASLLNGYKQMIKSAAELNSFLRKYEVIFSKDVYEKINLQHYSDRPLIIYLKEFQELLNLEELIDTIYNTFKIQDRKSVKVLRLFDSSGMKRISILPDKYKVLYNQYLTKDIFISDYLCKFGDYLTVLEHLLLNRVNLDILVIVDCKDSSDIVLNGTILQFNLCRDADNLAKLGMISDNVIVNYDKGNENLINWHAEPVHFENNDEKFMYLSSRPAIQRILELSRVFEQTI